MNLLFIIILWVISIGASYSFCLAPIIALIKEAGDQGYKINYDEIDKITDIINTNDEEKINNLLFMMPVINIIYSLSKSGSLMQKKALILSCLNSMNAFKKMTPEEIIEYTKTGNFLLLMKSEKVDEKINLKTLGFTLKLFGFINCKQDCNAYYCVNDKLKDETKKYRTIYKDTDINTTEDKTIRYVETITSSNEEHINLNIGYLVKNPKQYNSKYKLDKNKLLDNISEMKKAFGKFNEETIESAKENNIFPNIKENVICISSSDIKNKLVLADTFFNEIENNGYTANIKFTNFNNLTYKLLLNKSFGLNIELVKNKNLSLNNDKTKKLTK